MKKNKIIFNKTNRKHSLNSVAVVPKLIIVLGLIGGFIMSGYIGMFIGPFVFSIGYKLFDAWMADKTDNSSIS
jgi:predicted PurR-regulated permease PerM